MNSSSQTTNKLSRTNTDKDHKLRSCTSTARLCDWTSGISATATASCLNNKEMGCLHQQRTTASQLKTMLMISTADKISPVSKTDYIEYTTNGRMFARDKKVLTKGEREIIEGIYKNRGDITDRDFLRSKFMVRSHKEAWYSGKTVYRSTGHGATFLAGVTVEGSDTKSCCHFYRDSRCISCLYCEAKRKNTPSSSLINKYTNNHYVNRKSIIGEVQEDKGFEGYLAPPSTPDSGELNLRMRNCLPTEKSLPTCLVLQTDNLCVHNTHYSKIIGNSQRNLNSFDNARHKTTRSPHLKSLTTFQRWVTDDFAVSALKSPSGSSHEISNHKKTSQRMQNEIAGQLINNATSSTHNRTLYNTDCDWADNKETDGDKKVKVNIYLPTADIDIKNVDFLSPVSGFKNTTLRHK